MARLAEQSRGSGAEARPHCQPHAPTARVTVPPHTEFHRAVAGVPLSLAQPAAPVHCHILPGITPARTLQCQWHRAGGRAQHWHHSDPPLAPDSPQHSQALQVDEAQEGATEESCQGVLSQVPASTRIFSPIWHPQPGRHQGYPRHLTEPQAVPMHPPPTPEALGVQPYTQGSKVSAELLRDCSVINKNTDELECHGALRATTAHWAHLDTEPWQWPSG